MHITYALVYYFSIIIMIKTVLLFVFAVKSIRKKFFSFVTKNKLYENQIINAIIYLFFALILIILVDSVITYFNVKNTLPNRKLES